MMSKAEQERRLAQQAAKTLPERETYSAKQAAMRLATDARTFRKFLRSSHCSFEAVGQGKRYDFTAEQLIKLRDEFIAWREYSEARRTTKSTAPPLEVPVTNTSTPSNVVHIHEVMDRARDLYLMGAGEDFDDMEPTEEELIALESGDFDED